MPLVRSTAALLLVGAVASAVILPDDNRAVHLDGVVRYPVKPRYGGPVYGKHSKRQIETDTFAKQSGTLYTIDITIGTPGETVPVQFDTGSSELWVNPVCSKSTNPTFCSAQPRYTNSTTIQELDFYGSVVYGTGYVDFQYVVDYVSIGSAKITQQIFGVAYDSAHSVVGIMGAGPELEGWDSPYPLPIDSLASQGLINSRAFSMDLRGFNTDRGSVIFGGIDVRKYKGNLKKLPIIPAVESPDGWTRFWVYLNGISINQPNGNVVEAYSTSSGSKGQPVLLDSGYTLSALPKVIVDKIVEAFPSAEYLPDEELWLVDCLDPGQGGSLDFTFGDKVINVPYYDFVWHAPVTPQLCVLGVFVDDFPVLGDTFLRSAYVVYDWDNREIHLAQSVDCGTELVAIGKGVDAVPNIEGKCGTDDTESSTTSAVPESTTVIESTTVVESTTVGETTTVLESTTVVESTTAVESSTEVESTTVPGSFISSRTSSDSFISSTETEASTTSEPPNSKTTYITSEVVTATTTVCPETTGTYTITKTLTCHASPSCPYGSTTKETVTVTVTPIPDPERTTHIVPGCTPGAPGPSSCIQCSPGVSTPTTLTYATVSSEAGCQKGVIDCPGLTTATHHTHHTATPSPTTTSVVVEAGAARAGAGQILGALGVGALMMILMGM